MTSVEANRLPTLLFSNTQLDVADNIYFVNKIDFSS